MSNKPVNFYVAGEYPRDRSLGWLCKRFTASMIHQADKGLCTVGLTHAQWGPLFILKFSGESTVAGLAGDLDMDAGALTRLLDRLEVKSLVQRERSSEDRRVVMVSLTDEGKRITAKLPAVFADVLNAHLAGFTHAEIEILISMLQRVVANGDALRKASQETE